MGEKIQLVRIGSKTLTATLPFSFKFTLWKPSHFPTTLEAHTGNKSWRTFRLKSGRPIGVVLRPMGMDTNGLSDGLQAEFYSSRDLDATEESEICKRLSWSYNLEFDLSSFYERTKDDAKIASAIQNLFGMRSSCPESIFEILVISLILQNTTVARSAQMLKNLLEKYGDVVEFDGHQFSVFCDVQRLAIATQDELRGECRLGYRAKYLPSMAQGFVSGLVDDDRLRTLSDKEAQEELMRLKGVGPYSAFTVMSSGLQRPNHLNLDSWNTKIFSTHFFGHEGASKEKVTSAADSYWGGYKGLAALYILEDLYRDKPVSPLISE